MMATADRDLDRPLDRFNAYLDAQAEEARRHRPAAAVNGDRDPILLETVRRLRALDASGAPDPALSNRVWRELMNQFSGESAVPLGSPPAEWPVLNGRAAPRPRRAYLPMLPISKERRRWVFAQLATALLLLVTLFATYVAFRPEGRPAVGPATTMPAVVASPTTLPIGVTEETLFSVAVPVNLLPQSPAMAGFSRSTLALGVGYSFPPSGMADYYSGVAIEYVVSGTYAVHVDGPLQVVRADAGDSPGLPEVVPPGTEVTLQPGDVAIYPENNAPGAARNAGQTSLMILSGSILAMAPPQVIATPIPTPEGVQISSLGNMSAEVWSQARAALPPGPVTFTMRRFTLASGASLASYVPVGPELTYVDAGTLSWEIVRPGTPAPMGPVTIGQGWQVPYTPLAHGTQLTLSNEGDTPLVLLTFTITPAEPGVAPIAVATPRAS